MCPSQIKSAVPRMFGIRSFLVGLTLRLTKMGHNMKIMYNTRAEVKLVHSHFILETCCLGVVFAKYTRLCLQKFIELYTIRRFDIKVP